MHEIGWTFLTNHSHVLLSIQVDPEIRIRDLADRVGITERAAHRIVSDLKDGGIISVTKQGRRNCYTIHAQKALRHPLESHHTVGDLLQAVGTRVRRKK